MTFFKRIRKNLLALLVIAAYIALLAARPAMGVSSLKNSLFFVKEMILIMPVIFVLTALLDLWVPKEKIVRYLGRGAGIKGVVLSLVLGSISAGPIYAAFPLCVMLHKKGASVRNIVIILSAWAVIKVPMLLNEMKFLGLRFMAIRWILTVIAIIIFSWLAALIVKDSDLPLPEEGGEAPGVNEAACMGCGLCARTVPELFEMRGGKAAVRQDIGTVDAEKLALAADRCPVKAIRKGAQESLDQPSAQR
jgi:uncharacterized membrane protein YraQ (UPF0718 family)